MKKRKTGAPDADGPITFETFREPSAYTIDGLTCTEPSCFNGWVQVRKWRITIESVDEPTEAIHARLQDLWDHCDNWHHAGPLKTAAKAAGYELKGPPGALRRKEGGR